MPNIAMQLIIDAVDNTKAAFASAQTGLSGLKSGAESMKPTFQKMAGFGTAAFATIAAGIGTSIKAFADSQEQLARVDQSLENMSEQTLKQFSGGMDQAKKIAREFGAEIQALGGIGDETASEGFAKLLLVTNDSTKAMEAASLAADLATFKQIDYSTAVDIVGKVLNGNTGILGKYGIELDKNATKEEAIAALTTRVAGQYEAYGKTLSGQTEIMKQSFGDLQENIGQAFIPILMKALETVKPVIDAVIKWTSEHPELTKNLLIVAAAVSGLIAVVGLLGLALPAIIAGFTILLGPVGLVIIAIAAVTAATILLVKNWEKIKEFFKQTWDGIKIIFNEAVDSVMSKLQPLLNFLEKVRGAMNNVISGAQNLAGNAVGSVKNFIGFDDGGIVPGGRGQPRLAVVHGGETILPTHKSGMGGMGTTINLTITGNDFVGREGIAEQIGDDIIRVLQRSYKI